ncbi:MAG: NAD kinase [Flavobacteriales bacterium]|nr:NAD kinase [Flavobacteriales bacterium]
MRIGINLRRPEPHYRDTILGLLEAMHRHGLEPVMGSRANSWLKKQGGPNDLEQFANDDAARSLDMLFSLGGDGTFLRSVGMVAGSKVPVLGINLGRLGFLADVQSDKIEEALAHIANGRYELEQRTLLRLEGCDTEFGSDTLALNDVSVHKRDRSSMIAIHTFVDERFLNTYWADGLIIATPTGSTAYSLSCGGPILDPSCGSLVITPIAPHNLNVRPFVVPDECTIRLVVDARSEKYLMNLDARGATLLGQRDILVRKAAFTASVVHLPDHDPFTTLRNKLNWGLDARSTEPPQ